MHTAGRLNVHVPMLKRSPILCNLANAGRSFWPCKPLPRLPPSRAVHGVLLFHGEGVLQSAPVLCNRNLARACLFPSSNGVEALLCSLRQDAVAAALQRLIQNATAIREAVDLTGAPLPPAALAVSFHASGSSAHARSFSTAAAAACRMTCLLRSLYAPSPLRLGDASAKGWWRGDPTGASIAIDDRFEVWESGYISIPFDFQARVSAGQLYVITARRT